MDEVITKDGRTLAVEQWGVPTGTPVVYLHGSPMSRLARHPDDSLFERLGIRLITYDRPGFGCSTPLPGRRVVDAAEDVAAVADHLGLDRFAVFGVSGGGPHALAFAARYPERVTRVGALASLAPRDAAGLDWTAGMNEGNTRSATVAVTDRQAVLAHLSAVGTAGLPPLPEVERAVLSRPEIGAMLGPAFAEAVRPGLDGWVDDVRALFGTPWGFDPAEVSVPVRLWHGGLDTLVPPAHAEWLAARMPTAGLTLQQDAGHGGHFDATPAMLAWLVGSPGLDVEELLAGRSVTVHTAGRELHVQLGEPSAVDALPRLRALLADFASVRERATEYLWDWDANGEEGERERADFLAALAPTTLVVTGGGTVELHYEEIDEKYLMDGYWPAVHLDRNLTPVEVTVES